MASGLEFTQSLHGTYHWNDTQDQGVGPGRDLQDKIRGELLLSNRTHVFQFNEPEPDSEQSSLHVGAVRAMESIEM